MQVKNIDLYKKFDRKKDKDTAGSLFCYLPHISDEVDKSRKLPAVLIIPGGGYARVSQREAEPIALRYMAKGYAAFVLDYSVAPHRYPTAFLEAAMAMIYLRSHANELSIDSSKVAALGFSAGGHLCGCLATLFDDEIMQNEFPTNTKDVRPDAVILSYPVISSGDKAHKGSFDNLCSNDSELREKLSLENRVKSNSSPAFIWHTIEDSSVSVKNSLLLASAYDEHQAPFSLHIFEKGTHGLSTADWAVYKEFDSLNISTGIPRWIDMSIEWMQDRGIGLQTK